jgi:hypothetical protein
MRQRADASWRAARQRRAHATERMQAGGARAALPLTSAARPRTVPALRTLWRSPERVSDLLRCRESGCVPRGVLSSRRALKTRSRPLRVSAHALLPDAVKLCAGSTAWRSVATASFTCCGRLAPCAVRQRRALCTLRRCLRACSCASFSFLRWTRVCAASRCAAPGDAACRMWRPGRTWSCLPPPTQSLTRQNYCKRLCGVRLGLLWHSISALLTSQLLSSTHLRAKANLRRCLNCA